MLTQIQRFIENLQKTSLALIKILILSKWNVQVKISRRKNSAVILGNGPSFNQLYNQHKNFLTGKDIFCVNLFPTTRYFEDIKPIYFIVCAPEFWLDGIEEIYKQTKESILNALSNKVNWDLTLLIPFSSKIDEDWQRRLKYNTQIQIMYFNETGIEGWDKIIFWLWKKGLGMPRPHNIIIPAIFNAINLWYKEIFLWGVDQNQIKEVSVDKNNTALLSQRHFYDHDSANPDHMRKMGKGKRKIHEILHKFMITFAAYHELRKYADTRDVRIYNMSPDSLIDAFERFDPLKI
jgi:hypothetical protein